MLGSDLEKELFESVIPATAYLNEMGFDVEKDRIGY
jgi:hypothetical protein